MTTINQELKKLNIDDTEIEKILESVEKLQIKTENDLFDYTKTLPETYKKVLEIYLRYEKMIPFRNLTDSQAFQLFTIMANSLSSKNVKIFYEYFTGNLQNHQEKTIIAILSDQIEKQNNLFECFSLLYFINNKIKEEEINEVKEEKIKEGEKEEKIKEGEKEEKIKKGEKEEKIKEEKIKEEKIKEEKVKEGEKEGEIKEVNKKNKKKTNKK